MEIKCEGHHMTGASEVLTLSALMAVVSTSCYSHVSQCFIPKIFVKMKSKSVDQLLVVWIGAVCHLRWVQRMLMLT